MGHNNLEGNSTMNDVKKVRRKRLKMFLCSFAAYVSAAIFIGHEVTHSMLSFDLTETEMLVIIASAYVLLFAGCSASGENVQPETVSTDSLQEDVVTWKEKCTPLGRQYRMALATKNCIFGCYMEHERVFLDSIDKERFTVDETFELSNAARISGMAANREGSVYILDRRENNTGIWEIDSDGAFHDYVRRYGGCFRSVVEGYCFR